MNRVVLFLGVGVVAAALCAPGASMAADRWELDNGPWQGGGNGTENLLYPGTVQDHDMEGAADEDWMIISQRPFSSYEIRVDGMGDGLTNTGPVDLLAVDLVESDGTLVASGYYMNPFGVDRRVTFSNNSATVNNEQQIRISSPSCNPCTAALSGYTIHLFDTTYNVSRFNNAGSQTTVVILQNTLGTSVSGNLHFFNPGGTLLASHSVSIAAHGTSVINTPAIPGVAGVAGSMVLTNSGGYGALSGKAIALEPSTGFTFDTLMVSRPQ